MRVQVLSIYRRAVRTKDGKLPPRAGARGLSHVRTPPPVCHVRTPPPVRHLRTPIILTDTTASRPCCPTTRDCTAGFLWSFYLPCRLTPCCCCHRRDNCGTTPLIFRRFAVNPRNSKPRASTKGRVSLFWLVIDRMRPVEIVAMYCPFPVRSPPEGGSLQAPAPPRLVPRRYTAHQENY